MPNITTCSKCGGLYEAGSNEEANEPVRLCFACQLKATPGGVQEFRLKQADTTALEQHFNLEAEDREERLVTEAMRADEEVRKGQRTPHPSPPEYKGIIINPALKGGAFR